MKAASLTHEAAFIEKDFCDLTPKRRIKWPNFLYIA